MTSTTPRFLYFDLGNVIVHFDHDRMCRQLAEVAGVEAEQVRALLFDTPLLRRIETGELDNSGWYQAFCQATKSCADPNQLMLACCDIFWLNEELVPVLTQLAAANWPMGILSNTSLAHWEFLADGRYGILPDLFDPVVLSYQVQAVKPEPKIFALAAERAGCKPREVFYTDDRPENVEGACVAGMDAVLFTSVPQLVTDLRARGVGFNY